MTRWLASLAAPKGPSFKNAQAFEIDYSGNKVRFCAPAYSHVLVDKNEFTDRYNIYDHNTFFSAFHQTDQHLRNSETDVPGFSSFRLRWGFERGLVIKSEVVTLTLTLIVRKIARRGNLFSPAYFEQAIMDTIDVKYGPYSSLGEYGRRFDGPLNWQHKQLNGLDWLGYHIFEHTGGGRIETQWCTPLTDEHFLCFAFDETGGAGMDQSGRDTVNTFIKQVIERVKIHFTPDVEQARDSAPNAKFSASRKPRYWMAYDEDPEQFLSESFRNSLEVERRIVAGNLAKGYDKHNGVANPTMDERFDEMREKVKKLRDELGLQPGEDPDEREDRRARGEAGSSNSPVGNQAATKGK